MAWIPCYRWHDPVIDSLDHARDFGAQHCGFTQLGQRRHGGKGLIPPQQDHLHGLIEGKRFGRHLRQMRIQPHKDEGRLDGSVWLETKGTVLVGLRCGQPVKKRRKIGDQLVKIWHKTQFVPIAQEEHHQIGTKLGVGFGHAMPRQHHNRFDRAFDHGKRRVIHAKNHWHDGTAPAGTKVAAIASYEQFLDLARIHGGPLLRFAPAAIIAAARLGNQGRKTRLLDSGACRPDIGGMSLPHGFLDELRTRISLSQVVGRKVTWDMRKSNMAKGDWWSPCPFHQEKSASFHVDDRKGFYYCFGCHAKGDALSFIKETENLGFMEAVEVLAREAGMTMPARDPKAAEKADHRTQLAEVMEEAVKWFRLQLKTGVASDARAYLTKRGLSEAAQERWEIGFAPDARTALFQALTQKGFAPDLIVNSGVCARPDDGGTPYDRFRGRIIFPIRDGRGRAISLGGRSLDPNARAKYLNGPETDLFDKGRSLFNQGPAREAAGKGQPLVVAEGYMDVIALSEAGFKATVAPLGTAVTEDQLRLLWRISDEPVIALDGDTAGFRAALRVIDLALPLLEAPKGLRFAILPTGLDPDDLIKQQGAPAMQAVLDAAQPMVSLLWKRETEGKNFDSPERKAALDKTLREALKRISDPSIRSHYGEEIKRLREVLFGTNARPFQEYAGKGAPRPAFMPRTGGRKGNWPAPQPVAPMETTRTSLLASAPEMVQESLREAVILAGCVNHPGLIHRFESALERLEFRGEGHDVLRNLILYHQSAPDLRAVLMAEAPLPLEAVLLHPHVRITRALGPEADPEFAANCLAEAFARLQADRAHRVEIADAEDDVTGVADEGLTWRVSKAAEARHSAARGPQEAKGESVIAPNGIEQDRDELDRARKLHDSIDFTRGGRGGKH
jgi:DNA primase